MENRDCLPAGEYVAAIAKSERRDARKPGNAYPVGLVLVQQDTTGRNACIDVPSPSISVP